MPGEIKMVEIEDGTFELTADRPLEELMVIDDWLWNTLGPRDLLWKVIGDGWILHNRQDAVHLLLVWG